MFPWTWCAGGPTATGEGCELAARPSLVTGVRSSHRAPMEMHGRFQHVVVLGSVFLLALTGLPQKLNWFGPSEWLMDSAGGIETLRAVHHGAGVVLIVAALYHVLLVLIAVMVNRDTRPLSMVPDARDYSDAIRTMLYFAGLRRERPVLREPTYFQKLDYWVLVWGLAAMGLTGIVRLFPVTAARLLSSDGVAAALEAHSDLAVLVVVWVAVVHVVYCTLVTPSAAVRRHASGVLQEDPRRSSAGSRD